MRDNEIKHGGLGNVKGKHQQPKIQERMDKGGNVRGRGQTSEGSGGGMRYRKVKGRFRKRTNDKCKREVRECVDEGYTYTEHGETGD